MAKADEKEFKELQKENKEIRDKIEEILSRRFSSIDDDYLDLESLIPDLIENEIEQEKFCNQ